MDYNLKCNIHIYSKWQKLDNATWFLHAIACRFAGADYCTCQTIYKEIVLSILMLRMLIWMNNVNKSEIAKIEKNNF